MSKPLLSEGAKEERPHSFMEGHRESTDLEISIFDRKRNYDKIYMSIFRNY